MNWSAVLLVVFAIAGSGCRPETACVKHYSAIDRYQCFDKEMTQEDPCSCSDTSGGCMYSDTDTCAELGFSKGGEPTTFTAADFRKNLEMGEVHVAGGSSTQTTGHKLTCNDGRTGVQQCVHYTFTTAADRDGFYDRCPGLTSRTKNQHNCPSGAVGGGYCRHTTSTRTADTYTYTGSASEVRSRCTSTQGTWR